MATTAAAPKPIVAPDLSPEVIAAAETAIIGEVNPYIPAKVRAAVYTAAGAIIVVFPPIAAVVGGEVGSILTAIASAAGIAASTLAVSHITK
jgi:hypothetical protein